MRRRRRERRLAGMRVADRGSATLWVLVACLATWSVATFALSIGGVVVARHRAASAADLAALAGARTLARGSFGDPCAEAARVAAAARARLIACDRLADGSLQVVAEAALASWFARWPDLPPARARARAATIRVVGLERRPGVQ